jgi:non-specific serine/threonine protein kinase
VTRHNLPQPLSSFVGREHEIDEASRMLGTARLLTLTGAGGIGKTRLGLEIAGRLIETFRDGVWLVELAPLSDATLVPRAVANVLSVPEDPGRPPIESLAEVLRGELLLLVLDNCEHLIEACAALALALLRTCPGIRIVATSRHLLGIEGETTLRVPSLALAQRSDTPVKVTTVAAEGWRPICARPSVHQWSARPDSSEAVHLFVERAQAVAPGFELTERNAPAVQHICEHLDGIPLAIELAAARVTVLSPEQIVARLGDRFGLLTGGSRGALPRHQTLMALLDWSYDLLDAWEQVLLRRLSVFVGGWTLEAAEAVCASDALPPHRILDLLSGLVAKSLVLPCGPVDEVRYRFLESIREYAQTRLRDAGEESFVRMRHRDWFLSLAERAEPELKGAGSVHWLDRLERERENLWAALSWSIVREAAEAGLRLAGALARFWLVRGPYRETRAAVTELLGLPGGHEPTPSMQAARAKLLCAAGGLAMRQDNQEAADGYYQEALQITQAYGNRPLLAVTLFLMGHLARVRGQYATARKHHWAAIRLFEVLGDDYWMAYAHHDLGLAAYYEGDLATARTHYQTALTLAESVGDVLSVASALNDLGEVAFLLGDLDEACLLERKCLAMARAIGDKKLISMTLGALAGLAAAQQRPAVAARLAAAVHALDESSGLRHSPAWHALLERWLEPAIAALGADAWAAEEEAGQALPLDRAIDLALADAVLSTSSPNEADTPDSGSPPGRDGVGLDRAPALSVGRERQTAFRTTQPGGALTQRELEVAVLVARGMTNPQIAAELIITPGTASNHVKHILGRLGFESRVQIAAWAVQEGLLPRPPSDRRHGL